VERKGPGFVVLADGHPSGMEATQTAATSTKIAIEDLALWHGAAVIDRDGDKLGTLDAVFYDVVVDDPAFIGIKSGTLSKKLTLVSLHGAVAGRDYLRVDLAKSEFKGLPSYDTDVELSADDEQDIYTFFALPYKPAAPGARRLARR
jgi:hypothetical protein